MIDCYYVPQAYALVDVTGSDLGRSDPSTQLPDVPWSYTQFLPGLNDMLGAVACMMDISLLQIA